MNYRHSYHAGNFADVFKHIILVALIKSLLKKENAFLAVDTHAGAGFYDLFGETSQKTKEYEHGIMKLIQEKNPPFLVKEYLRCIQTLNNRLANSKFASMNFYPGSPMIMRYYLRNQDRMVLSEFHPQEYELLKTNFQNDRKVSVHQIDAYQGLKAFLPPKERRGLILIDPPYEKPTEFAAITTALPMALKRFETGVYALWYPIKDHSPIDLLRRSLKNKINRPALVCELSIYPENTAFQLNGSGMLIINPPWQFDQEMQEILPWLWKVLSINHQGKFSCHSL